MSENVQAELMIRLLANDVVVAESKDPVLWQKVLASVMKGGATSPDSVAELGAGIDDVEESDEDSSSALGRFAEELGVGLDELQGALSPTDEAPYMHIDARTWEAFKQNFPDRGSRAVPGIVFAGTALARWFSYIGLGNPTQAQARAVLATANVESKNPSRSLRNCEWLQNKNGVINVHPARITQAESLLRSFCLRQGPSGDS